MRGLALLAVGALCAAGTACNWLMQAEAGFADEARVRITGTTPVPLHLVTSTHYTATRNALTGATETNLITADTIHFDQLPLDRSFDLRGRDRFLVRLVNPDTAEAASVHVLVQLDGNVVFTENAVIRDASLQYITYFDPR